MLPIEISVSSDGCWTEIKRSNVYWSNAHAELPSCGCKLFMFRAFDRFFIWNFEKTTDGFNPIRVLRRICRVWQKKTSFYLDLHCCLTQEKEIPQNFLRSVERRHQAIFFHTGVAAQWSIPFWAAKSIYFFNVFLFITVRFSLGQYFLLFTFFSVDGTMTLPKRNFHDEQTRWNLTKNHSQVE